MHARAECDGKKDISEVVVNRKRRFRRGCLVWVEEAGALHVSPRASLKPRRAFEALASVPEELALSSERNSVGSGEAAENSSKP